MKTAVSPSIRELLKTVKNASLIFLAVYQKKQFQ